MTRRVLVAGIGNIFLGDDGFGVEVAGRLAEELVPDGVRVADYGIRGLHLAYELLEGYDALVLVDAVPMGSPPGTLAVIEPQPAPPPDEDAPVVDAHSTNPTVVLDLVAKLGGTIGRVLVVGCEPATIDEGIGLSEPVAGAVDRAVQLCQDVLADLFDADLIETGKDTRA
jgi:hydrogenase maturation protease